MLFSKAKSEETMWDRPIRDEESKKLTVSQINEKYDRGEQRIVTESNREKLPNFVEALKRPGYMDLRPFYQRRSRWEPERQSKLIESFIINVPVPPIFLYERNFNSYEIMDGQQRVTAIKDFYENKLVLCGLELWPELNGFTYEALPPKIRAGIDRRSISSIVLLKESAPNEENAVLLRQLIFERLNTGGVKLEKQEIRNALYRGPVNEMLLSLSRLDMFRQAWRLPLYSPEEEKENSNSAIHEIKFFSKMEDLEVILRFFALRHIDNFRLGMQPFLDLYMVRSESFSDADIAFLENLYRQTLCLANDIFGDLIFRPYDTVKNRWADPQKAFCDAVMVGLSCHLESRDSLIRKRDRIIDATTSLFRQNPPGTFTGRANTKRDVEERISLFENMISVIAVE